MGVIAKSTMLAQKSQGMTKLGQNALAALNNGSRNCTGLSELRGAAEGIAQGDLNKTILNGAILGLGASQGVSGTAKLNGS